MFKLLSRHGSRSGIIKMFCNKNIEVKKPKVYYFYSSAGSVRFASNDSETVKTPSTIDNIPEPPPVPDLSAFDGVTDAVQSLSVNGEPTFASLGLGGWSPVGIVQQCLEYLHVSLDVPWWGAILVGTVVVRVLMFPLVIMSQRNTAKMNNHLPEIQTLQLKMTQARQTGNQLETARYGQEMMLFMKEKGLNPLKNLFVPLAQAPLFISFFMGLRGMANCPVESMMHGGMWWFEDLTVPDQYFILPLITSATMWVTIELGVDGVLIKHTADNLPIKKKGFVAGVKESWTNMKISRDLADRQRVDEMIFTKAGKGPLQKTYKFDPTKISKIEAKSK
ncbi:unnamed protein product [Leptidea sinapis]|uniref:Membrane insertase YidC/Oxa/ALB C-terminal domain-containing protein n=1 Tax=Leptidea sinapis TaxID=189913 RepID=A0A5E4QWM0_9NEOP|nr:unnamed protein product [Leptidea sinapis]